MFMKCVNRMLTVMMMICVLALPFASAAQALSADDVVFFSVDGCIPETDYAFMLLKQGTGVGSIRNNSILYINQLTAKSSSLEVAVVYPEFTACDVVVGGAFSNGAGSPRYLGTYTAARLPAQLNEVGEEAFMGSGITHAYLSEQVTVIRERAFADCQQLAYIYIPESVTEIAANAFDGCDNVVIGCAEDSQAQKFAEDYDIECKVIG